MEKGASRRAHAVLVSSPGMGHLTPLLGLANRLSSLHSFKVTILFVSSGGATHAPVREGGGDISVVKIPAADISNIVDPGAHLVVKICALMRETTPSIRKVICGLREPSPTMVILDLFAVGYLSIARELALPCYVLVASAWCVAYHAYSPVLDKCTDDGEFLNIPGCKPLRREDVIEAMTQRNEPQYTEFMHIGALIPLFDGVITRSWQDLEGSTLAALREGSILQVPVYDIGPIVVEEPYSTNTDDDMLLMEWLDRQPAQSVIYVSFGSGGTLSKAQMKELAWGLELSQQRFVWVVRQPVDHDSSGTYLGLKGDDRDDMDTYFPPGFKEKTHGVGMLVPQWAPQSKVLSHPSVGGFLTHCGWNSIMESLSKGVPMLAWPMFAEQRMNAALLVEEVKVAVRPSELGREEIAKTVRSLFEGEEACRLRCRAKHLQREAAQALTPNGSSYNHVTAGGNEERVGRSDCVVSIS
ncbi:uncharacterized protein [Phyllobates terribilis]|uniref:uncharacterized protein n=1 Tax=Phyllobates terribilis TaxID=111132 RepID=UPI003CCB6085